MKSSNCGGNCGVLTYLWLALVPPARASGDGSFPCSDERHQQLPGSTSSCYFLPMRDGIQKKFLFPPICCQQELHCQREGTVLHYNNVPYVPPGLFLRCASNSPAKTIFPSVVKTVFLSKQWGMTAFPPKAYARRAPCVGVEY